MSPNTPTDPPAVTAAEGTKRERLAAYFLSMPPISEQTPDQRQDFMEHLRQLGTLEDREVVKASGARRPLVWGNPVPLLQSLLTAAQHLAAGMGQPILVFPAKETVIDFETLLHPRLLGLAMADLLRLACLAAPRQPVWVRLQEQSSCLTVSVTAEAPLTNLPADTWAVIKESARLHGGSLALCDNVIGFSCGRVTDPPADVRPYRSPSAEELLGDTLSSVWTNFYCWLPPSSSSADNSEVLTGPASSSSESSSS